MDKEVIGILMATVEGGVLCHQEISREAARRGIECPEIAIYSLASSEAREVPRRLRCGDNEWVSALAVDASEHLRSAGATFGIIPANLMHVVFDQIQAQSALPLISILDVVALTIAQRRFGIVSVLGTKQVMEDGLYDAVLRTLNISTLKPSEEEMTLIDLAIFDELIRGAVSVRTKVKIETVVRRLRNAGADVIVLGCTELGMVIDERLGLPVIDSALQLAHAALNRATIS